MASKGSKPTPPASFVPGSRATAPMPLEESSESAWEQFQALQKAQEGQFQSTRPDTRPQGPDAAYDPTQPMGLAARSAPAAAPARTVTLEEVMAVARRNNRACPLPGPWAAFHKLLPARAAQGRALPPPPPVDGPAWTATSAMQKRLRLRDQIEWAEREGALQAAHDFLAALAEDQWHHFD